MFIYIYISELQVDASQQGAQCVSMNLSPPAKVGSSDGLANKRLIEGKEQTK
jgi:hypothetical protein